MTCAILPLSAQVSTADYVITRTQLDAAGTKYLDAVQYYDGAGFPTQSLLKKITPSQTNLFTLQTYDNRGRDSRKYLPMDKAANKLFLTTTEISSWSAAGYASDSRPYAELLYESAPSSRKLSVQGPGDAWIGHSVTTGYGTNSSSGTSSCKWYVVLSDGTLSDEGTRPAGTLRTTTETDEDGGVRILFSDSEGRTLLSRVVNGTETLDTYSVYDGHGNLRYVLEPMYQVNADMAKYAFVYAYDVLGHIISEQKPGCGTVNYWYDRGGHMVFSQDAVQASGGTWTFHLWDNRHREVLRGVCTKTTADQNALSTSIVEVTYSSSIGLCGSGYSTSQLSLSGAVLLEATYYDDYSFLSRTGFTDRTVFPSADSAISTNGLPTGRLSAALESSSLVHGATYYDAKGRATKTVTTNLKGGAETETITYTYTDQPSTRSILHTATGITALTETYNYTYDHADRLTSITHQVGNGSIKTILANTYDMQGRLLTETFEGSTSTKRTYSYDIRSHVTGISAGSNGALFSESIGYVSGPSTARYGGAPSSVSWKVSGESGWRGYLFSYDGAGRLTDALYGTASSATGTVTVSNAYTEKATGYDRNGNITSLQRYGKLSGGEYGLIDNLTVTLSGNWLASVSDAATGTADSGNTSFIDGASVQTEYNYDAAGRLTADANKGITSIGYNVLGLPSGAARMGITASWVYDGAGTKLRRTLSVSGYSLTTDYVGNAIYTMNSLTMLQIPNGFVTFSGTTPTYHYYQKDHLGSNRLVTSASGTVEQVTHYYPFGGQFGDGNSPSLQQYKFTGKEWESSLGVNVYDFGARTYDPALLRWTTPDPLMGKYPAWSPYVYCGNSPIAFIDSNGLEPVKKYAGTVTGFVRFINSLSTGIGSSTGTMAHEAMLRMGMTKGIKPANTAPFNTSGHNRYIYTEKGGWIDMAHFMFYAGRAYQYKLQKEQAETFIRSMGFAFMPPDAQRHWVKQANINPTSEAIQDGYLQEFGDLFTAPHSAYSYEDLPTDRYGADFGANYFDPNSSLTFSEQIQNYLLGILNATNPEKAPNYNDLPEDYPDKPTHKNKTTIPIYIICIP